MASRGPGATQREHLEEPVRPPRWTMGEIGYAAAVLLAGLFAWAGAAKLAARERTRDSFAAFGLPSPGLLAVALPVGELALALGLLTVPAVASFVALGLLAAFTTFVVRAARGGAEVGCGCFGSARAEPVGAVEVVRNGLMAAAALAASFATGPVVPGVGAVLVVTVAAALGGLTLTGLRRRPTGLPRRA